MQRNEARTAMSFFLETSVFLENSDTIHDFYVHYIYIFAFSHKKLPKAFGYLLIEICRKIEFFP